LARPQSSFTAKRDHFITEDVKFCNYETSSHLPIIFSPVIPFNSRINGSKKDYALFEKFEQEFVLLEEIGQLATRTY
jgi:hypothetical protein